MSEPIFQKAETMVNFPAVEAEILRFWKENQVFEKSLAWRAGAPPFVFYEGPPTANGVPHNGHVLTRVIKDLFLRYRTMRGYYVPRKAGWDTHGLPVEVEVEKELGIHGKAEIENYGVEKFIGRCIESVFRYTSEWERMTERIGFWVDLSDAYVTYHRSYVESVWWALAQLFERGLLYRGHKVIWWWPAGGTALSSAEVGLNYKTVDDPSVYVAFPLLSDPGCSLLVWTTTPWTLPSNMYTAVKPALEYVEVEYGTRRLILAAALKDVIAQKLNAELPVRRTYRGEQLVGLRYQAPFAEFFPQLSGVTTSLKGGGNAPVAWKVLAADFVTIEQGTGLVHIAPAFGEDDHNLHRETIAGYKDPQSAPLVCTVAPDGKFTHEIPFLAGMWVKDADPEVVQYLRMKDVLIHRETYRHDYPFCWRADDDPLIQYARPTWFIRTTALLEEAKANNQAVDWLPEHIKDGRFGDFLNNNVDWALSRERYWGTPLPIWVNDVTGKTVAMPSVEAILAKNPRAFDHFEEARRRDPSLSEHLMVHIPWIDEVTFTEAGEEGVYRRVPEVIDVWFDAGSMPFAQWGYPHKGREQFEAAFPADFITEAIDQTRGWFYALLMISTLAFDRATQEKLGLKPRGYPHPFKTCIVLGHVTDKEGKKESKSKGNYTPPEVILDRVALDFAVVGSEEAQLRAGAGKALIAREDLEGLDLAPGAKVLIYQPGRREQGRVVALEAAKKLPRRVVVLAEQDAAALGVTANEKGLRVMPVEVPRLAAAQRVTIENTEMPAPGADAFRWFFYAANPPWSPTRHSLGNVRAMHKEFPLKLRNVYSFFTIYAGIDGYHPAKHEGRKAAERALLDRWILSELNRVNEAVVRLMDSYHSYEAARELSEFVDGLSNWWLRRSRARFWKAEFDLDKRDAYATLYECLVRVIKMAAPFVPFMAEELYQNLVRRADQEQPLSVHLCDYPQAEVGVMDAALSEEMRVVRDVVSLGLRVRNDHKLKVRQPLAQAAVILSAQEAQERIAAYSALIADELNVKKVEFVRSAEEYVCYKARPNFRKLGPRLGALMPAAKRAFEIADAAAIRAELMARGESVLTVEGAPFAFTAEEVEILVEERPGYAAAGDSTAVVVLSTELTPELVDEGMYRELLNRVQTLRKELELEYTQRIRLALEAGERMRRIVEARREHLMEEVLCTELAWGDPGWAGVARRETDVEGEPVTIFLKTV